MGKKKRDKIFEIMMMFIEKYLAAGLVLLLGKTWQYNLRSQRPANNVIYVFWHRNMLPLLYLQKFSKLIILISSSKDGELIAGPAKALGYQTARGSSTRGGSSALKELIKRAKKNSIAITPDGPKGPNQKIKDGVIYLALLSKQPIVPVAVDIKNEKVFNSWDKFRFPKLFSPVNVVYGDPIYVNSKEEVDAKILELQAAMDNLTEENIIR